MPACLPSDDAARVAELHRLDVLDTPPDPRFDSITELTRRIAATEIGIISLVDRDRQWFKSCVGACLEQRETPRDISFCGQTILQREPLIICDTHRDSRFAMNPLVQGEPFIRFYAGFPLITANGFAVGSLCAISREPHQLSEQQIDSLRCLALLTMQLLQPDSDSSALTTSVAGLKGERFSSASREMLQSLASLISRDQMVQQLDLLVSHEMPSPFAVLRCWFRDYERVNSTLGGLVAEQYIDEAARRVVASLPPSTSVARFADAEFVILLPFVAEEAELKSVTERILSFADSVFRVRGQSLSMSVSVGIAVSRQNYTSTEAILADTSMAVRMARRSSASAFRFISSESRLAAKETYRFESEFREALVAKALEPHLQPIVDLTTGDLLGFEALARWPRKGIYTMPSVFMPIAWDSGLAGELDLVIIEKALAATSLLAQPIPHRPMRLSVNLSGILLEDMELRKRLLHLLDDNPCPPGWTVQVELVEDLFQDTSESFTNFLVELVQRGVVIAIDDFGTGYSSFSRLVSLPIQSVKVDRVFISRLNDPQDTHRKLLRTMLSMLHDLGLDVTAEGVETEQQREWLISNGAAKAQGYLFGQPFSISEAIAMLHKIDYRPSAIPVDRSRISAARRRRLGSYIRWPFLKAFFADRRNNDSGV